ncbi:flagellar hook-basal body complex protein FliE [Brevundimonas aurifodinae]|uniref:Flagellar hook-basal body complex protein FliE n=2 Tax=Brevundimonas TaxID=41275 RepID=A0ABV1NSI9_9CAUL|nr:MAG: flagellar hook-basal body complex protein FliE [Brevundimonas sp. 12-68-7]OYX31527.1 MAG: flagellar hook-basal body complex protein FliE [Brevundimonas subvibrioides]
MNPLMAARAYAATQGVGGASAGAAVADAGGPEFSQLLQNVMGDMTQATRAAETQMTQTVQGQGSMIDVVTAVSAAEASLETVIAVRDQVISAYQEIMRMPI